MERSRFFLSICLLDLSVDFFGSVLVLDAGVHPIPFRSCRGYHHPHTGRGSYVRKFITSCPSCDPAKILVYAAEQCGSCLRQRCQTTASINAQSSCWAPFPSPVPHEETVRLLSPSIAEFLSHSLGEVYFRSTNPRPAGSTRLESTNHSSPLVRERELGWR